MSYETIIPIGLGKQDIIIARGWKEALFEIRFSYDGFQYRTQVVEMNTNTHDAAERLIFETKIESYERSIDIFNTLCEKYEAGV